MSLLRVQVSPHGRQVEELFVETPEALVGSAAHCDIRLPMEDARPQHVRVRREGSSLMAFALSGAPLPRINGVEFNEAPLAPTDVMTIGATHVRIAVVHANEGQNAKKTKAGGMSPVTATVVVLTLAASAAMLLLKPKDADYRTAPAAVPDLWAAESPKCPQSSPEQAEALAIERSFAADGKRERSPFHPEDGVGAVALYGLSAACFDVAHDEAAAREARSRAAQLRTRLLESYRFHRVRLDHALAVQDWTLALDECRVLGAFLAGNVSEYASWLSNVERLLSLKYGGSQ